MVLPVGRQTRQLQSGRVHWGKSVLFTIILKFAFVFLLLIRAVQLIEIRVRMLY